MMRNKEKLTIQLDRYFVKKYDNFKEDTIKMQKMLQEEFTQKLAQHFDKYTEEELSAYDYIEGIERGKIFGIISIIVILIASIFLFTISSNFISHVFTVIFFIIGAMGIFTQGRDIYIASIIKQMRRENEEEKNYD